MNCFNCEVAKACKSCLDLVSQKKTYSTDINMLKRKPANDCYQMLPYYLGEYEPRQNNIVFESSKEALNETDEKMVEKKRYGRYIIRWNVNHTFKTKIILKTTIYLFMDSNVLKELKSIIVNYSDVKKVKNMKITIQILAC